MKKFTDNLKRQIQDNPIAALAVGAVVVTAMTKFLDANTARTAAKTHALEVNRRIMQTR